MGRKQKRNDIIQKLSEIAFSQSNDAVKLVFLDETDPDALAGLDLRLLTGVKRSAGGAIEIQLADRLEAVELLAKLVEPEAEKTQSAGAFFRALEETARLLKEERERGD